MTTNIQDKIIDLFPTKDQFWRRFFPIWFLFNWKYFYVLFESSETLYPQTRLEYVSFLREQSLMSLGGLDCGVGDWWMFFWNLGFSLVFPFFLVRFYYRFVQPRLIQPVYKLFLEAKIKKQEALSDMVAQQFRNNQLKKLWLEEYEAEININEKNRRVFLVFYDAIVSFKRKNNTVLLEDIFRLVQKHNYGEAELFQLVTSGYLEISSLTKTVNLTDKAYYVNFIVK